MTDLVCRRPRAGARLAAIAAVIAIAVPILAPAAAVATASGFLPYQAIALPSELDAVAIGDVTGDGRATSLRPRDTAGIPPWISISS